MGFGGFFHAQCVVRASVVVELNPVAAHPRCMLLTVKAMPVRTHCSFKTRMTRPTIRSVAGSAGNSFSQ